MFLTALLLAFASAAWASCPAGTIDGAGFNKCYKVNTELLSFLVAEQRCNKLGGNLVSIENMFENTYVSNFTSTTVQVTSFWIGANYLMNPQWTWTTGKPVIFTNWAPNEPIDPPYPYECAALREPQEGFTKHHCNVQKASVCQFDPNTSPSSSSPSPSPIPSACPANPVCSPGYTFYIGTCKCYKLFDSWVYFTYAQTICAQENGVLPKIADSSTNEFLYTLVNNQYPIVWIGLNCPNGRDSCQWQDGTPLGTFRPFSDALSEVHYTLISAGIYGKEWEGSAPSGTCITVCQKDPTTTTALLAAMEAQSPPQHQVSSKDGKLVKYIANKQ